MHKERARVLSERYHIFGTTLKLPSEENSILFWITELTQSPVYNYLVRSNSAKYSKH